MHSWVSPGHPELETYARNVGLGIERLGLDGIIVRESPVKRNFAKLLKDHNASWVFDLHSDATEPYWVKKNGEWVRVLPYPKRKRGLTLAYRREPPDYSDLVREPYPIARIEYGGDVRDPDAELSLPIRNCVGELLDKFERWKYDEDALVLDAFWPMRRHERLLGFGLVYVRPLHVSIDLVKSLAEYLYERL